MAERSDGANNSPDFDDSDEPKQEMAKERTDWALERTLLAKQRNFGAWLRTGLAAVAVGFGAAELLGDLEPRWAVRTAASLLVLAGAAAFVLGYFEYRGTFRKLEAEGLKGFSPWIITAITGAMLTGAALLLFAVVSR